VAEGLFVVASSTRGGLVTVDGGREGCLRSAERLAKEKLVDASECRIEALLFREPIVMV